MNKQDRGRLEPFVPLDKEMMDCPAWRTMSHGARLLYVSLKRRWNYKKRNNGSLFVSQREERKRTPAMLSQAGARADRPSYFGAHLPLASKFSDTG